MEGIRLRFGIENGQLRIEQFRIENSRWQEKQRESKLLKTTTKKTAGLPDWFECLIKRARFNNANVSKSVV